MKWLNISHEYNVFAKFCEKLKGAISGRKILVKYCNFKGILKIVQETRCSFA